MQNTKGGTGHQKKREMINSFSNNFYLKRNTVMFIWRRAEAGVLRELA
jgi:hypothetical protein